MLKSFEKWLKYHLRSDSAFHKRQFKKVFGYIPDLNPPQTMNEFLLWRKLYDRNPLFIEYADKYRVRDHVDPSILVPLYGAYDAPEQIDYNALPDAFVIKVNHGSGQNIIVHDKAKLDIKATNKTLRRWLRRSHHYISREWHYKKIKPKIIIEKLLITPDGKVPDDFKFHCFDGKVAFVIVDQDRFGSHRRINYSRDFEPLEFIWTAEENGKPRHGFGQPFAKPRNFEKMIEVAESLSKKFNHVRIDLYNLDGEIYFGEFTFVHAGASYKFFPEKYDRIYGQMALQLKHGPDSSRHKEDEL